MPAPAPLVGATLETRGESANDAQDERALLDDTAPTEGGDAHPPATHDVTIDSTEVDAPASARTPPAEEMVAEVKLHTDAPWAPTATGAATGATKGVEEVAMDVEDIQSDEGDSDWEERRRERRCVCLCVSVCVCVCLCVSVCVYVCMCVNKFKTV